MRAARHPRKRARTNLKVRRVKQKVEIPAVRCRVGGALIRPGLGPIGGGNANTESGETPMSNAQLETAINAAWEARDTITPKTGGETREAIEATLDALDSGALRVAERHENGEWHVNQWAKKAVLLGFRIKDMEIHDNGPQGGGWWDKVDSKFKGWGEAEWRAAGFRAVPNCVVRRSAYIAPGVVLMPSFVNLGAYVDSGTMVDTWATVGSCAQIGRGVHLSGGVGIGGVLEPMQAGPTIIEDNCFIGARSEVVEGCIIREGSVLGMGVFIGKSTKIVDRETGEVFIGEVPSWSVVVSGSMPSKGGVNLYCAVIVKRVDAQTRAKTGINELLRD
jgi:2,3,4,5-tetrahydropyridine-2-carboxylate N-succinyltransferase